MTERKTTYIPPRRDRSKRPGPTPTQKRINFAQSLANQEMISILQCKLMEARAPHPQMTEVALLPELVHEIKHRLTEYNKMIGDLPKAKRKNYDEYDSEGEGSED